MDSRATRSRAVTIVIFILASIFVALRFVSRCWIVRRIALHDYIMLLAWVSSTSLRHSVPCADGPR